MAASTACGSMWIAVISMEKAEPSRELQISGRILRIGLLPLRESSPEQRRLSPSRAAPEAGFARDGLLSGPPLFFGRNIQVHMGHHNGQ